MSLRNSLSSLLPSIPYAHPSAALRGYWLPQTSTINWCEEDYYATIYIAELVNTLTNGLFVLLAIKGVRSCLRNDHDRIFLVTFCGYAAVGTGSFLFHGTLKYPMQLIDELSMIYTTCFSCYASFSYRRSRTTSILIAIALTGLALFITGYYHYLQDPLFHQRAYALLTATLLIRSMITQEVYLRPRWRGAVRDDASASASVGKEKEKGMNGGEKAVLAQREQKRVDERDLAILKTMWSMVRYGLAIFLGAFAIWNGDNKFCGSLRGWRREVGLPWGVLLEGHGWWHIGTGIGAYFFITWAVYLRHCLNGKQDQYELYWPRMMTSIPVVVKKDGPDAYLLRGLPKRQKLL